MPLAERFRLQCGNDSVGEIARHVLSGVDARAVFAACTESLEGRLVGEKSRDALRE